MSGGKLPFNKRSLPLCTSVIDALWRWLPRLGRVVELARMGKIRTVVEHFPFERVMDARIN
jgi:hypothetical protein